MAKETAFDGCFLMVNLRLYLKKTSTQVFSCKFYKVFEKIFVAEHLSNSFCN